MDLCIKSKSAPSVTRISWSRIANSMFLFAARNSSRTEKIASSSKAWVSKTGVAALESVVAGTTSSSNGFSLATSCEAPAFLVSPKPPGMAMVFLSVLLGAVTTGVASTTGTRGWATGKGAGIGGTGGGAIGVATFAGARVGRGAAVGSIRLFFLHPHRPKWPVGRHGKAWQLSSTSALHGDADFLRFCSEYRSDWPS